MSVIIDSRCGLHCSECEFVKSHGCSKCIESDGKSFYGGVCCIAKCCTDKGFKHCGECPDIPCAQLKEYSNDSQNGDTPPGLRIEQCKKWAKNKL